MGDNFDFPNKLIEYGAYIGEIAGDSKKSDNEDRKVMVMERELINYVAKLEATISAHEADLPLLAAMEKVKELEAENATLREACKELLHYREMNCLNFQLEKADEYMKKIRDAVFPVSEIDKWRIGIIQQLGQKQE